MSEDIEKLSEDIYLVDMTLSGTNYGLQFGKESYYEFCANSHNPEYIQSLIQSDVEPTEKVSTTLKGILDAETGETIDLLDPKEIEDVPCSSSNDHQIAVSGQHETDPLFYKRNTQTVSNTKVNSKRPPSKGQSTASKKLFGNENNQSSLVEATAERSARKIKTKLSTLLDGEMLNEAEAYLLGLVFERPIIFDYTLPIQQRNPASVTRAWTEICSLMELFIKNVLFDGDSSLSLSVQMLKDTWLNLRSGYMRYKASVKHTTGMSPTEIPPIKHLELLQNYDNVAVKRGTLSTMEDDEYDEEYAANRVKDFQPPTKRGKVNDDYLAAAKKVLVSVSNRIDNPTPSASNSNQNKNAQSAPPTSSSLFCESLVHDLNSLNAQHLASAKMKILQVVWQEIQSQNENK